MVFVFPSQSSIQPAKRQIIHRGKNSAQNDERRPHQRNPPLRSSIVQRCSQCCSLPNGLGLSRKPREHTTAKLKYPHARIDGCRPVLASSRFGERPFKSHPHPGLATRYRNETQTESPD